MLEFTAAEDDVAGLIRSRRTVNDFLPQVPPRETLLQAIELARWAPNHKLTEPWRFHLLGPQTVEQVIRLNAEIVTAQLGAEVARKKNERWLQVPGWVVVTCIGAADPVRDRENEAAVCCAIQNLMLFLWSKAIGTKWVTGPLLQDARAAELLQLSPGEERIVGVIWYGYPAQKPESRRRPVTDITIVHP